MTDVGGDFGDPRPDHGMRRRLREALARPVPMGESVRGLLRPFASAWYVECVECGRDLTDPGVTYYVERALRGDEPLFEFAMCEACIYGFEDEFSEESIKAIGQFWLRHADLEDRERRVEATADGDGLVDVCLLSGKPRDELEQFQVWAWCRDGEFLVDEGAPGIVSGAVLEGLVELLSQKTRDTLDDFVRDKLGLPPELQKLPVLL